MPFPVLFWLKFRESQPLTRFDPDWSHVREFLRGIFQWRKHLITALYKPRLKPSGCKQSSSDRHISKQCSLYLMQLEFVAFGKRYGRNKLNVSLKLKPCSLKLVRTYWFYKAIEKRSIIGQSRMTFLPSSLVEWSKSLRRSSSVKILFTFKKQQRNSWQTFSKQSRCYLVRRTRLKKLSVGNQFPPFVYRHVYQLRLNYQFKMS